MQITELKHILRCLGVRYSILSGNWLNFSCLYAPFYHKGQDIHPSAGVLVKTPYIYRCFCCGQTKPLEQVCHDMKRFYGVKQQIDEALALLSTPMFYIEKNINNELSEEIIWPETYLDKYPRAYNSRNKNIHPYLIKRGLNYDIVKRIDCRYDGIYHRICFPIYNKCGCLVGMHGRSYIQNDQRHRWYFYAYKETHRNKNLWLGVHWIDWDKPIIVAESIFDLAKILYGYDNVLSPLTASISKFRLTSLEKAYYIITAFDNDAPGDKARKIIENVMRPRKIKHLIPETDFGDMAISKIKYMLQSFGLR